MDQILKLEERFIRKNLLIIEFYNRAIDTEPSPKVMEIYQYSLNCYLESMEAVEERITKVKNIDDRVRLLIDRDSYLNHVMDSNGIKDEVSEEKKKTSK